MPQRHLMLGAIQPAFLASLIAIGLWALCLLIAVLSYGTVDLTPQALSVVVSSFAVGIGAVAMGFPDGAAGKLLHSAIWLLVVLLCLIGLQIIPLPFLANPAWSDLAQIGVVKTGTISVAPADTVQGMLPLSLPFLMFFSTLILFQKDETAARIFGIIAIAGGVIATLTLVLFLVAPNMIMLHDLERNRDAFSAFLVNRNNGATFLGVTALMLCPVFLKQYSTLDMQPIIRWILNGNRLPEIGPILKTTAIAILISLTLAGLFLTKSRGGVMASFCGFLVFFLLMSFGKPAQKGRRARFSDRKRSIASLVTRLGIGLLALLLVLALFGGRVIFRAETLDAAEDGRLCVLDGLLSAASSNWLTGSGFGAFAATFPAYRDPYCGIVGFWDRAHNSYLEAFIGLGIISIPLIAAGIVLLFRPLLTGLKERRRYRSYPAAGIAILVLILVHAVVDFSLQIPGVAIYVAVCLALISTISLGRSTLK